MDCPNDYYYGDSADISNLEFKEENRIMEEINRLETGGDGDEEIRFGEQLQDDLINSFCDKLQSVCPQRLEAFLAIQFLMITDKEDLRKHVSGKHSAIQVLYDRTRAHYIMAHYDPRYRHVEIYDSLQPYEDGGKPMVINELATQICHLFGHLHQKYIPLLINREFESQSDNFSCGYRVVAALVDLARGRNPSCYTYSRRAILAFMRLVLNDPSPKWEMFESANFGTPKYYSGHHRIRCLIVNTTFVPSEPSSSYSSRSSSADSLKSIYKRSYAQIPLKRVNAGHTVSPKKQKREDCMEKSVEQIENYFSSGTWINTIADKCDNIYSHFFRVKSEDYQEEEYKNSRV
uniref:ULP_PROTEASE domain-containing protein n=1 Tax=Caenorhabditis tropicalis TaxID=1561998 RepID=A0A1I7UK09_9PELO